MRMSLRHRQLTVLFFSGVLLQSCVTMVPAPPRVESPVVSSAALSRVVVPVTVRSSDIVAMTKASFSNPVYSGSSGKLDVTLLGEETIPLTKMVKEIVSPEIPGHFLEIVKSVPRQVEKALNNLLTGDLRDAFETVWDAVKETVWVDSIAEVSRMVATPVLEVVDKSLKIAAWVNYSLSVQDMSLTFQGNRFSSEFICRGNVQVDYEQGVVPFGPTFKVKGLLNGDVDFKVQISGTMEIQDLSPVATIDKADVQITHLFVPGAVQGMDFAATLTPGLNAVLENVKVLLVEQLRTNAHSRIAQALEGLDPKSQIANLAKRFSDPFPIRENSWLAISPRTFFYSDLRGETVDNTNQLRLDVGVEALTVLSLGRRPGVLAPEKPMNIVKRDSQDQSQIETKVFLELKPYYPELLKGIDTYVSALKTPFRWKTKALSVYPSAEQTVVALTLSEMGSVRRDVTLYLWGSVHIDNEKHLVSFVDLQFTAESESLLLKLAPQLFRDQIVARLTDLAKFSFEEPYQEILNLASKVSVVSGPVRLSGSFPDWDVSGFRCSDDAIEVHLRGSGVLAAEILRS